MNAQSAAVVIKSRFLSVNLCFFYFNSATSPDVVAEILLMTPKVPWQNFAPFLGAAAHCSTKIDNFIRQP